MRSQLNDQDTYSVAEVVRLSGRSESTVRRQVGRRLRAAPSDGPMHLTKESVDQYCRALAQKMPRITVGGHPALASSEMLAETASLVREVAELKNQTVRQELEREWLSAENEKLRHTIQSLRQSLAIVTDELGAYTSPAIPNN